MTIKIKIVFAWYDFWIGFFYDRRKKRLYVFPVPCFGICFDFGDFDFHGTTHYRCGNSLAPICGIPTVGDPAKVTCDTCLEIMKGRGPGVERFRDGVTDAKQEVMG